MLIVNIIFLISLLFINIYKSKRHLHMMQQNLYNENNRFLKWVFKNKRQVFLNLNLYGILFSILLSEIE